MRGWHRYTPTLVALAPSAAIVALMVMPLIAWLWWVIIGSSLQPVVNPQDLFLSVFWRTLWVSSLCSVIAVFLGGCAAFLYVFSRVGVQRWLMLVMTVPLLVGYLARNYSWLGFLSALTSTELDSPWNAIGQAMIYRLPGVIIVMATVFIPFAFILMLQGLLSIRRELFVAAQTLGCSNWVTLRAVIWPLIRKHIVLSFLLCLVLALGYFVTPRMIGGGNYQFAGNEIFRVLSSLGDVIAASKMALYLFSATSLPIAIIVCSSLYRQPSRRGG